MTIILLICYYQFVDTSEWRQMNLKENYECENKGFEKINKFCKLYEKKNCMKNFENERMGKDEQVLNYG